MENTMKHEGFKIATKLQNKKAVVSLVDTVQFELPDTGPYPPYIGQSKMQRVIIEILSNREIYDGEVWRGALSMRAIRRLLFKNNRMTAVQRASLSRSIRRLGVDGLVVRERGISDDGYTTHVGLTERGWYQAEFNRTWYSNQQNIELLTFWGILTSKYGRKVNKIRKEVNRG